ncbi:MAG: hypothetical protein WC442_04655 [Candidatus Omnitrophota bacterium]
MDDNLDPEADDLELTKYYSKCLRCGEEISRSNLYTNNNKFLRCESCNKEWRFWNIMLYLWFILGIPITILLFKLLFPENIFSFIFEYALVGYLVIGSVWCLGLVIIEIKKGK